MVKDHTWSDNKVRELATMCLPWQHWTKALVWFDDANISVFHSCVVVDLWQSLSEWHLLLFACVWCAVVRMSELEFAKTFWRGKMTFWAMSSQVMKHGSTNRTLKRSGKVPNGRLPIPHDQKNFVSPNQQSKQCCSLFFYIRGIVLYEFVPTGQTVNQVCYLEVLGMLREKS